MSAKVSFRQSDVERMIRAVKAQGLPVAEVLLEGGRVRILTQGAACAEPADPYEEWVKSLGEPQS